MYKFSGKEFQAIRKRLRAQNARFKKMTRQEQRIAIAKDVIKQIDTQEINARSTYLSAPIADAATQRTIVDHDTYETKEHPEAQALMTTAKEVGVDAGEALCMEQCDVCGIGSLFVAAVKRNDKMPFHQLIETYNDDMRGGEVEYLKKWFDSDQLDLIEGYYERHGAYGASPIYQTYDNNKRLIMIMENIISNKGKFDPNKGKHAIPKEHQ